MNNAARWIAGTAILSLLTAGTTLAAPKTFVANDYGAAGDGKTLDTSSIQKAIDAAAVAGGTVTLKPGTYLTGSLFLKSGVTLDVPEGSTIIGSEKLDDYPMLPTRIAGIEMTWPAALINVRDQQNVTITGKGTIDGDGPIWWKSYWDLRADLHAEGTAVGLGLRRSPAAADTVSEFVQRATGRRHHCSSAPASGRCRYCTRTMFTWMASPSATMRAAEGRAPTASISTHRARCWSNMPTSKPTTMPCA